MHSRRIPRPTESEDAIVWSVVATRNTELTVDIDLVLNREVQVRRQWQLEKFQASIQEFCNKGLISGQLHLTAWRFAAKCYARIGFGSNCGRATISFPLPKTTLWDGNDHQTAAWATETVRRRPRWRYLEAYFTRPLKIGDFCCGYWGRWTGNVDDIGKDTLVQASIPTNGVQPPTALLRLAVAGAPITPP